MSTIERSLKVTIKELKISYGTDFTKLPQEKQTEVIDRLSEDFNKTFNAVVAKYGYAKYGNSIKSGITEIDTIEKENKYKNFIIQMIVAYSKKFNTDVFDWDDFKIAYWLGYALTAITKDKSHLIMMITVLNGLLGAKGKILNKDMIGKIYHTIESNKDPLSIFSNNYFGINGLYFTYKSIAKS